MRSHISNIIELRKKDPNVSVVDIITEYIENHPDFDFDEFIVLLKKREYAGLKEYLRKDMIQFNFAKGEELSIFDKLF